MKHLRLLAVTILIFASITAGAQRARIYTSTQGLANSHIHDIYQDSKGFIWISTENGLSKFDGIKFSTLRHDRSRQSSIASNTVRTVFEDSRGVMWVGTSAGLQTFSTQYNRFRKINLEDWSVPDSDQHIISVTEFQDNEMGKIIATSSGHGIYVLDAESHKVDHDMQDAINRLLPSKFISGIFKDSRDRLWAATDNGGITVIDIRTLSKLSDIWDKGMHKESEDIVNSFTEDPRTGNIYLGTKSSGVLLWDAGSEKIRRSKGSKGENFSIMSMIPNNIVPRYGDNTYLIGLENHGIKLYDAENESIRNIRFSNVPFNISRWKVQNMLEDNQGNVWVGALQTGVMIIPKSMFGFRHIDFNMTENGGRGNISVTSVISDEERDCLWVGTDGGGLFRTDAYGNSINLTAEDSEISNNSIMSLALDNRGTLWVATYLGGLWTYTPEKGFRQFKDQNSLNSEKIYHLTYSADKDIIYAGTHGNGFSMIDAAKETVMNTWSDDDFKWISCLSIDSSGFLWIGTYNGAMAYDSSTDNLTRYDLLDGKSIRVYSIYESDDRNIWIGTGEGLILMKKGTQEKRIFTEEDGLANNSVSGILEDNEGYLWISTLNGLSRLDVKTETFKNFYQYDGLQENEFNARASFKAKNGRLYFGGINGLTAFSPNNLDRREKNVPPLYLSSLKVMNRNIRYNPRNEDDNILDRPIAEATQITLPSSADMFTVGFSVLEYTNPYKIVYEYMMDGVDKTWNITVPDYQTATYTNIPAGRYKMQIKAFYEGKPEAFSYREINIRILPPWYLTIWAWIAYIILGILTILAIFEYHRRRVALKKQKEESEIKEMKLKMFTNISHEIRTPLTLVMSPLKKMRENENDPHQKELYNLMYRNSLRILRLVNQLMDIRKIDNGQMNLHFVETDMVYFIKDIMQSFDELATSRSIDFNLNSGSGMTNLWIDQGNFDKVIFNLLSNAFKYTPDKGKVSVSISDTISNEGIFSKDIAGYVEFIIENTGVPVEERHLARLFDRFYQADTMDAKMGSGVGLNLAKMLVDLHHGEISAHNTATGMAFRIRIPVGCDHLSEDEMTKPESNKDLYTKLSMTIDTHLDSTEDVTYSSDHEDDNSAKSTKKKTLILIDDDSEMRAYLKLELQNIYNVETYDNGKDAWARISTSIPDAVVTDLLMEKMDGAELCEKMKKNPGTNHIPVILLTSATDELSHHKCIESGADRFLTKPVSLETLKSAIASSIATREAIKSKYGREIDYGYSDMKIADSDNQLTTKVVAIIRQNMENPEFSVEELAREIGMSRVHLNRKLKETMNISPSNLIKSIRMKQAAYLLINNKVNISEVAYKVGFSTHSYFSNSFHDYFGMTPKEFTAQYMNCTDEETLKKLFG